MSMSPDGDQMVTVPFVSSNDTFACNTTLRNPLFTKISKKA